MQPKQMTPSTYFQAVRCYAASAGLSQEEVNGRIMDLLKNFDKVPETHYAIRPWLTFVSGPGRFQGMPDVFGVIFHVLMQRQLNIESHFHNDLGLDSLDTVEVVMAIEEVSTVE